MDTTHYDIDPPKWPLKFLRWIIKRKYLEEVEGDMEEVFRDSLEKHSTRKARLLYTWEAFKLVRPALLKDIGGDVQLNHYGMTRHNFLFTLRRLKKYKLYSVVSIIGLSMGLACFYGVFTWWKYLLDYDGFHEDKHRIYGVITGGISGDDRFKALSAPLLGGNLLHELYPSVEAATFTADFFDQEKVKVSYAQKVFYEKGSIITSDSGFFDVFRFPVHLGDVNTALHGPNKVVLNRPTSEKLFEGTDPIGKTITIHENGYEVTAVVEVPPNSQMQFGYILSGSSFPLSHHRYQWHDLSFPVYLKLRENAPEDQLMNSLYDGYISRSNIPGIVKMAEDAELHFSLVPYQEIKYTHDFMWSPLAIQSHGLTKHIYLYLLVSAGLLILVIAALNFVNLCFVQAERDKRSTLIFTLFSSRKHHLARLFLEVIFIYLLSTIIAIGITWLFLGALNFASPHFIASVLDPVNVGMLFGLGFLLSVITVLSAGMAKPHIAKLVGYRVPFRTGNPVTLRAGLVVFQFTISIVLLLSAVFIFKQFKTMLGQELGFARDQIIIVDDANLLGDKARLFKENVLRHHAIEAACLSDYIPSRNVAFNNPLNIPGKPDNYLFGYIVADSNFLEVYEIEVIQELNKHYGNDWSIINVPGQKELGLQDGQSLALSVNGLKYELKAVIDPLFEPLHFAPRPMIIVPFPHENWGREKLSVRTVAEASHQALEALEKEWNQLTDYPFRYEFLDQRMASLYDNEKIISKVLAVFSWVAGVISLIGLLTITLNLVGMRTKEIAIRKVVGAKVEQVVFLLSSTFSKWLLLSIGIALPLAYFVLTHWLENFTIRATLDGWTFMATSSAVLVTALLTVAFHTVKAASANPVDFLRSE